MDCSRIVKSISSFMDGELDERTSRLLENHLDVCPACREYLYALREVDRLVHGLAPIEFSLDFASRVVSTAVAASVAQNHETISFVSRLKQSLTHFAEALFSLFEPGSTWSTHTLDEFNDCPPFSLSFVYFNLLNPVDRGC